jgi:beta-N-acetylhexosaminidase
MYDYSMEKLIYQMFILGTGGVNNIYLQQALKNGLGGIIYFTRDIESKEQFTNLINEHKSKAQNPLFLSIDQEGGRVERTENIHERYLSPRFAYKKGEKFLEEQTTKIANELREYGINLNFAPCADVNTNPNNPIIGERAFSDKTDDVIKGVKLVAQTYRKNGIIPSNRISCRSGRTVCAKANRSARPFFIINDSLMPRCRHKFYRGVLYGS